MRIRESFKYADIAPAYNVVTMAESFSSVYTGLFTPAETTLIQTIRKVLCRYRVSLTGHCIVYWADQHAKKPQMDAFVLGVNFTPAMVTCILRS